MSCNNFYDHHEKLVSNASRNISKSELITLLLEDPMIIDKPQKGKSCLAVITTWKNTRKLPCCMSLHMYELCQPQKEQNYHSPFLAFELKGLIYR